MRKLIMALIVFGILGIASCSKCTTCSPAQGADISVCDKDYSSESEYQEAVDSYESAGYSCFNSL